MMVMPSGDIREDATELHNILDEADKLTSKDRRDTYDHPLPNHKRIADMWNAFIQNRKHPDANLSPSDVCHMMILVKMMRDVFCPKRDNLVDIAGYARCIELIRERGE